MATTSVLLRLGCGIVMAICGISNWRIYNKYRVSREYTSASELLRRLRREKNPDGDVFLWGQVFAVLAGCGMFVAIYMR